MNTENSKTSEPDRFKLDLTDKINLKNPKQKHGFDQFKHLLHLEKHQTFNYTWSSNVFHH